MRKVELARYLDGFLRVAEIPDSCVNGLEVEAEGDVSKIALAVDATLENFMRAKERGADFILVHHGMIWDKAPISGLLYKRVKFLIENDLALYAAHLPLDLNPEVGNNAELARIVGLKSRAPFGVYHGQAIGFKGYIDPIRFDDLVGKIGNSLGHEPRWIHAGSDIVESIGICSGSAPELFKEAVKENLQVFLTGEVSHQLVGEAEDSGVNIIFAGHWATETVGVKALGRHISEKFGLPAVFVGEDTGF
ncbi:MAG TPA: Nif3-like dinuclear metal center hexameric protein [Firmicutes bacterium]|nr:Nif3-like dinuclear metal center hexameric protein [Bacillota bacterium]